MPEAFEPDDPLERLFVSSCDCLTGPGGMVPGREGVVVPRVYDAADFSHRTRMPPRPNWAIAWSDLMMTMFILFVVLYVYALSQKEFLGHEGLGEAQGASVNPATGTEHTIAGGNEQQPSGSDDVMDRMYDMSSQLLAEEAHKAFASVDLVPDKTVRIILTGDLLFASGLAEIRPEARESLAAIAQLLTDTSHVISVAGHTDDHPIATALYPSNWELSSARAAVVARYLIEQKELDPARFYITGHGPHQPLRPNNSPENRAVNRRVEVVITKEKPIPTAELVH